MHGTMLNNPFNTPTLCNNYIIHKYYFLLHPIISETALETAKTLIKTYLNVWFAGSIVALQMTRIYKLHENET